MVIKLLCLRCKGASHSINDMRLDCVILYRVPLIKKAACNKSLPRTSFVFFSVKIRNAI